MPQFLPDVGAGILNDILSYISSFKEKKLSRPQSRQILSLLKIFCFDINFLWEIGEREMRWVLTRGLSRRWSERATSGDVYF